MNTPHSSDKLTRWGMIIQELDLHIHCQPGRKHQNADALSRDPLPFPVAVTPSADNPTILLAAVQVEEQPQKGRKDCLNKRQRKDPELLPIILYLESGVLPEDVSQSHTRWWMTCCTTWRMIRHESYPC